MTNVTSGFSLNKRSSKQKGNLEWTIQRHWQHRAHMTRDKEPITCHKTWYGSHIVKTCFTPLCVSKQKKHRNKTWALLQTCGGKEESNIVLMRKS